MQAGERRGVVERALDWQSEDPGSRSGSATTGCETLGELLPRPGPRGAHLYTNGAGLDHLHRPFQPETGIRDDFLGTSRAHHINRAPVLSGLLLAAVALHDGSKTNWYRTVMWSGHPWGPKALLGSARAQPFS